MGAHLERRDAMRVRCEAYVENQLQRDNLCECVKILGGNPIVIKEQVIVEYEGENVGKMVELFEHYVWHTIRIFG